MTDFFAQIDSGINKSKSRLNKVDVNGVLDMVDGDNANLTTEGYIKLWHNYYKTT